jgi:hypothetical protein
VKKIPAAQGRAAIFAATFSGACHLHLRVIAEV